MDASDSSYPADIPLPPSPPPHDEPPASIMAILPLRDPVDENRARSVSPTPPEQGQPANGPSTPTDDATATSPSQTSTSLPQASTSSPNGVHESAPEQIEQAAIPPVRSSIERAQDTDDSVAPPTPPAKPVPSNPASPAARRPHVLPGSPRVTNGHGRPSVDSRPATPNGRTPARPSTDSAHKRSLTIAKGHTVSVVLISSALETIAASKEAKRSAPLRESVQRALEMVKSGQGGDKPREIFEPLRLACETRNEKLMIASLDCISKLISYSFFAESSSSSHAPSSPPPSPGPGPSSRQSISSQAPPPAPSLVDLVVHTITACHTESTPETVSLQIVKALLALVLSPTILVHQSSLLKAVRTVYNVFLLSADPVNQMVAQGGLTQMVNHVFARCKVGFPHSESSTTLSARGGDSAKSSKRPSLVLSPRSSLPLPSPSVNGTNDSSSTLAQESSEPPSSAASTTHTDTAEETLAETEESGQLDGVPNGTHHEA
uniref:Mon2/Sec7/BIG1-like dimerisation and cyclophilin-binding domain-containing protein n=1 Tax=Ganoderma boninense TaxID=34458 RepID=A0A5K1JVX5_9APHY|nr:Uncharacterized protein [Ganoderma boninense]